MALVKCRKQHLKNGESLGILAEIPEVEFDKSLLKISTPKNIPIQHQEKLNLVLTESGKYS